MKSYTISLLLEHEIKITACSSTFQKKMNHKEYKQNNIHKYNNGRHR